MINHHIGFPTLIVLLFIGIVFRKILVNKINNEMVNGKFGELNIYVEFKYVKYEFDDSNNGITIFNTAYDYGVLWTTPAPPSPTIFDFNDSHIKLCENLDLWHIFVNEINNEMTNENEFENVKCELWIWFF